MVVFSYVFKDKDKDKNGSILLHKDGQLGDYADDGIATMMVSRRMHPSFSAYFQYKLITKN